MLGLADLTNAQLNGVDTLCSQNATMLIGKMGSGKTIVTLTAIAELLQDIYISRVLVLTTKNVAKTVWQEDAAKWAHTQHLKVAKAIGTPLERTVAIESDADIVVMNYENVPWFFDNYAKHNFDGIVFDEIQKVTPTSTLFKRLRRRLDPFKWRVGGTGTPVSENFLNLFSMMHILDDGACLGSVNKDFKERYFIAIDYHRREWKMLPGADKKIMERIKHFICELPDYRHELPPLELTMVGIQPTKSLQDNYDTFKRRAVLKTNGDPIAAINNGVLTQKLHQFNQGFMYDDDSLVDLHVRKLNTLIDVIPLEPTVIVYWFDEDLQRLQRLLGELAVTFDSHKAEKIVKDWNEGKIKYLLIHPRSAGHGLNLERGGYNMVWYSLYWSRDLWEQTIGRLWRRGQIKNVHVYVLVMLGMMDEVIFAALQNKGKFDELFLKHLRDENDIDLV